jgi:hypothetical protein
MSGRKHPWGCTCRTHVDRAWRRSEHWSQADVEFFDRTYGRRTDAAIARHLKRTTVAVRLKAKRLGLHKRTAGFTARSFAQIFGVDSGTVSKVWIRRGLLPARVIEQVVVSPRLAIAGRRPTYWIIDTKAPERFILDHPEWVDVEKMPPSWYRELAAADPWISLPEAHRRTGRDPSKVVDLILAGTVRGRHRGAHWYIPVADVPKIPRLRGGVEAIEESWFRRQSVLEVRRNRRKGVTA